MRVVLDTTVVVSALVWGGAPFKLLQAATNGDIDLYTSPVLMAELREVLGRDHLALRLARQHASVESAISQGPTEHPPRALPRHVRRLEFLSFCDRVCVRSIVRMRPPIRAAASCAGS